MTEQEYRAHPAHSYSALKHALRSPFYYQWRRLNPPEQTPDMLIGRLAEAVIIDGVTLTDIAAVKPEGMKFSTKEGRAWRDEQTLPIVDVEDAAAIMGMRDSVNENAEIQVAFKLVTAKQIPMFGELEGFPGFALKGLPDMIGTDADGRMFLIDFKTCQDASGQAFKRTVNQMAYDLQAALYCELARQHYGLDYVPGWAWIAVEKKPPFESALWFAGDNMMERGLRRLRRCVQIVSECERTGEWPGVTHGVPGAVLEISDFELRRETPDDAGIPY